MTGCLGATEGRVTINSADIARSPSGQTADRLPARAAPLHPEMTVQNISGIRSQAQAGARGRDTAGNRVRHDENEPVMDVQDCLITPCPRATASAWGWPRRLLGAPALIILDEPTWSAGLDPGRFSKSATSSGACGRHTVILSSHILSEVARSATGMCSSSPRQTGGRATPPRAGGPAARGRHAGGDRARGKRTKSGCCWAQCARTRRPRSARGRAGLTDLRLPGGRGDVRAAVLCLAPRLQAAHPAHGTQQGLARRGLPRADLGSSAGCGRIARAGREGGRSRISHFEREFRSYFQTILGQCLSRVMTALANVRRPLAINPGRRLPYFCVYALEPAFPAHVVVIRC